MTNRNYPIRGYDILLCCFINGTYYTAVWNGKNVLLLGNVDSLGQAQELAIQTDQYVHMCCDDNNCGVCP